jgi:hypothetical protein
MRKMTKKSLKKIQTILWVGSSTTDMVNGVGLAGSGIMETIHDDTRFLINIFFLVFKLI